MEKRDFFVKIAHMYYVLKMTQDEIARRCSISRQKVNYIIGSLENLGIVSIHINGYENRNVALENAVEKKFNLKHAVIASVPDDYTADNIMDEVSALAADYLDFLLPQKKLVGVSVGRTLEKTVRKMRYRNNPACRIVQLFGVQSAMADSTKVAETAWLLAERLSCCCYSMYSPGVVSSPELRDMLLRENSIRKYMDCIAACDAAVVGIGHLGTQSVGQFDFFTEEDVSLLHSAGFDSVICLNPVRRDGSWRDCPVSDRIIGIDIPTLMKIPDVVAVSASVTKADAVLGVLRTGCVDTLVTDSRTAEYLCGVES